ncbi:MAG: lipoyl(octanoyl) transferase LipB [Saprospiraceae bacterium]
MHSTTDVQRVIFQDLGQMPYKEAWEYQQRLHDEVKAKKLSNRKLEPTDPTYQSYAHYLLFCDHPPVYTLGKSGSLDNLLLNEQQLAEQGFTFYKINRGGDITYHGPGQIVGYPIFDMDLFFTDIHKYVRYLEEAVILTLRDYGIESTRMKGYTGVWLMENEYEPLRKICAIGVHLSRWVTMHGFAFNVQPNLSHFNNIIPCGIKDDDKTVTSLEQELGKKVDIEEVKQILKGHFAELFQYEYVTEV